MTVRLKFGSALIIAATGLISLLSSTRASAPPGRYTVLNGTVRDNHTGLVWEQTPRPGGWESGCAQVGSRLPTVAELLSIVDRTAHSPAADGVFVTPLGGYWTSTPFVATPGEVWVVEFQDGTSEHHPPTGVRYVRCVR